MAAAKGGHTEVLRSLLDAGADPRARDSLGRDALMLACKRNKVGAWAADVPETLRHPGGRGHALAASVMALDEGLLLHLT